MIANCELVGLLEAQSAIPALPGYNRVVAVPYDFDYAGLVNASIYSRFHC